MPPTTPDVVPIARVRPRPAPRVAAPDLEALAEKLRARVAGEVRFDPGSRALYATDGSNYRQVPMGVVIPRHKEDVLATIGSCRGEAGAPILSRGGGTSLAGQCCNFPPDELEAIIRQGGRRGEIYGRMKALIDRVAVLRAAGARRARRVARALSSGWARGVLGGGLIAGAGLAALAVSASRTRRER